MGFCVHLPLRTSNWEAVPVGTKNGPGLKTQLPAIRVLHLMLKDQKKRQGERLPSCLGSGLLRSTELATVTSRSWTRWRLGQIQKGSLWALDSDVWLVVAGFKLASSQVI